MITHVTEAFIKKLELLGRGKLELSDIEKDLSKEVCAKTEQQKMLCTFNEDDKAHTIH